MKKIGKMVLLAVATLMASCQAGEELTGDAPLLQHGKLRLSGYSVGAPTRTHPQEGSADHVILWDTEGEGIQVWASSEENEYYDYLDGFHECNCHNGGETALFEANHLTVADLTNGELNTYGTTNLQYAYVALYDPLVKDQTITQTTLGTYKFTLGQLSDERDCYLQNGAWRSEYDVLFGECIDSPDGLTGCLLQTVPTMQFFHFFTSMEINLGHVADSLYETHCKITCDEGESIQPQAFSCDRSLEHIETIPCTKTVSKTLHEKHYQVKKIRSIIFRFPEDAVGEMNLDALNKMATSLLSNEAGKVLKVDGEHVGEDGSVRAFFKSLTLQPDQCIDVEIDGDFITCTKDLGYDLTYVGCRTETWTRSKNGHTYTNWVCTDRTDANYEDTPKDSVCTQNVHDETPETMLLKLKIKSADSEARTFLPGQIYTLNVTPVVLDDSRSEGFGYRIVTINSADDLQPLLNNGKIESEGVNFTAQGDAGQNAETAVYKRTITFDNKVGSHFRVRLGDLLPDMAPDPNGKSWLSFQFSTVNDTGQSNLTFHSAPKMKASVMRGSTMVAGATATSNTFAGISSYDTISLMDGSSYTFSLAPDDVLEFELTKAARVYNNKCTSVSTPSNLVQNITLKYYYSK